MQSSRLCLTLRLAYRPVFVTALLVLLMCPAGAAWAQSVGLSQSASSVAADEAITLTLPRSLSATERDELIGALARHGATVIVTSGTESAALADTNPSGSLAAAFEQGLADFQVRFTAMFARLGDLSGLIPFWLSRLSEADAGLLPMLLGLGLMLGIGTAAEWAYLRGTSSWRRSYEQISPDRFTTKFRYGLSRLVQRIMGLLVCAIAAFAVSRLLFPPQGPIQVTVFVVVGAVVLIRLALMVIRFPLAPRLAALRLVPLDNADATIIYQWLAFFAIVRGGMLASFTLFQEIGVEQDLFLLYQFCALSIAKAIEIVVYFKIARPIGDLIRKGAPAGQPVGPVREIIARTWHIFLIIISLAIFAVGTYAAVRGLELDVLTAAVGTRTVIILFPLIALALGGFIDDLFAADPAAEDEAAANRRGYARVTRRVSFGLLSLAGILVIADFWGVSVFAATQSTVGTKITGALIEIAAVVLIAYIIWEIAKIAIDRHIGGEGDATAEAGEVGGTGVSRIATMLPVLRLFLGITLLVVTVMVVLSALGVNIGPLLAGAGVVGLAVGFGAQTLVRDIISGMFFLMDDAFRKGEYIDVGSVMGTVERISIRSMQLRHHNGPVHTIPFGEITSLTNFSRDWAIIKFELRLPFETNIDKVRKIIKKVGLAMMEDDDLGPLMLEPLKSQGVNRMDDSALIIRCKLMAQPGQQFYVRREAFSRIQSAFAEQGIKFAPKRVIVETSTPGQTAAAAAAEAAAAQVPSTQSAASEPT